MKIRILFSCLLLVTLLAGCGLQEPAQTSAPTETTVPATTEASVSTEPEEITLVAVNTLAYRSSDSRPEICVLDGRTAAFLTVGTVKGDYSKKHTQIQVWDLYTDTMTAEVTLDGALSVLDVGSCSGNIPLISTDNTVMVLDRELNEMLRFSCVDPAGVLTAELDTYYYLWGDSLYAMDTGTGEAKPVELDMTLALSQIQSYDVRENILLATAYADPYTTAVCLCAIDMDSGETVLFLKDATSGQIAEGGICLENYDLEGMYSDAAYLDWDEGILRTLPEFMPNDGTYSTWHISGSDYICKVTFDAIQKDKAVACDLYRLGAELFVCPLMEQMDGAKINEIRALPDGNLLALEITRRGYTPFLICPEMLTFTEVSVPETVQDPLVDASISESYLAELNQTLPEELSQARQTADALEEEFGVTILLSNQCATAVTGTDVPITTTDQAALSNEVQLIENALNNLRTVLEMYPEGFFRQFQNEAGERGLLVLLVEDISHGVGAIGLCYEMGQWYPIAVDITSGQATSTYAHEIWHATENKINSVNTDLLSNQKWDTCNPSGYVYSYDTSENYVYDVENTFFYEHKETEVYFVDPYGKTNPHEDRARIMEYIMTSDAYARNMAEAPALRLKLKIMSDAIRQVFDTEQWGEVRWERFF